RTSAVAVSSQAVSPLSIVGAAAASDTAVCAHADAEISATTGAAASPAPARRGESLHEVILLLLRAGAACASPGSLRIKYRANAGNVGIRLHSGRAAARARGICPFSRRSERFPAAPPQPSIFARSDQLLAPLRLEAGRAMLDLGERLLACRAQTERAAEGRLAEPRTGGDHRQHADLPGRHVEPRHGAGEIHGDMRAPEMVAEEARQDAEPDDGLGRPP